MEITPRELRDVDIRDSLRGYNRDEVNDLLERAAATIEGDLERIQELTERLASAQSDAGRSRETEDVLHRTLLLAQRAADEAVAEATAKARQMTEEAESHSRRLIADSEAEARRKGEAERSRLEGEVLELAQRRDALLSDVEALSSFENEYRERMTKSLEADLFALRSRPSTAPGERPELRDVETPPAPIEDAAPVEDAAAEEPAPLEHAAPSVDAVPAEDAERVENAEPAEEVDDTPPPPAEAERSNGSTSAMATHEIDVRTLFEQSQPVAPAVADEPALAHEAPDPEELLANDGADTADVLDDDAFFATLRDAVHDESPLGPRDDNEKTGEFFDQDAEKTGFRDVFRRRR